MNIIHSFLKLNVLTSAKKFIWLAKSTRERSLRLFLRDVWKMLNLIEVKFVNVSCLPKLFPKC